MKKLLLLPILFFAISTSCQEIPQLKLSRDGIKPIIVEVKGMKAPEIYNNALNWVQEYYNTPDYVLKANIPNKKIRVNGLEKNAWWYKALGSKMYYDIEYNLEISFKEGKYRFYIDIKNANSVGTGYKTFFKKKTGKVKRAAKDAVPSLEKTINNLSLSFYNYVTGKTVTKDEDW
ncbi:DUF4468 domain-containing protein [Tenacibaculum sp. SSH1-16]|uniref:DUF4468 domain-containing protein n=1 Tax=Tenacibaculum sp. SSH1-16 TaxID=3136667 RepID=UPI0032C46B81